MEKLHNFSSMCIHSMRVQCVYMRERAIYTKKKRARAFIFFVPYYICLSLSYIYCCCTERHFIMIFSPIFSVSCCFFIPVSFIPFSPFILQKAIYICLIQFLFFFLVFCEHIFTMLLLIFLQISFSLAFSYVLSSNGK